MTAFNRDRIRQDLVLNDHGIHQSFMDLAYEEYNKNKDWKLPDMYNFTRFTYGEVVEMAVMLGNYNYQVNNGGHDQYFSNRYASEGGGCFADHDTGCALSRRLTSLMEKYKLNELQHGNEVLQIMKAFQDRMYDYEEPTDEDYQDYYEDPLGDLDDRYYKINDKWMKNLEQYFHLWMEHNADPIKKNLI